VSGNSALKLCALSVFGQNVAPVAHAVAHAVCTRLADESFVGFFESEQLIKDQ
jgi:hypothetical protein